MYNTKAEKMTGECTHIKNIRKAERQIVNERDKRRRKEERINKEGARD